MTSPYEAAGWAVGTKARRPVRRVYDPESGFWDGAYSGLVVAALISPTLCVIGGAVVGELLGWRVSRFLPYLMFWTVLATIALRIVLGVIGAMVLLGFSRLWRAVGLEDEMLYVAGLAGGASVTVIACPFMVLVSLDVGKLETLLCFLPMAACCQLGAVLGASRSSGFREKSLLADLSNLSFPMRHLFFATLALSCLLWWIKWLGLPVGWVYGLSGLVIGGQICSLVAILLLRSLAGLVWQR